MNTVAPWVEREISNGLQALIALRLDGAPASDTIGKTLDVWLAAIEYRAAAWREQADAPRIRRAFQVLFSGLRKWPSPAEFLVALPAAVPPPALPTPKQADEERARNRARIAALIDQIFNHHKTGA